MAGQDSGTLPPCTLPPCCQYAPSEQTERQGDWGLSSCAQVISCCFTGFQAAPYRSAALVRCLPLLGANCTCWHLPPGCNCAKAQASKASRFFRRSCVLTFVYHALFARQLSSAGRCICCSGVCTRGDAPGSTGCPCECALVPCPVSLPHTMKTWSTVRVLFISARWCTCITASRCYCGMASRGLYVQHQQWPARGPPERESRYMFGL